ncbi:MAG: lysophospholipid acyltransferase family protein [Clostridiales bacterium]|nr:lysophospholipid acyltransferase family protein [Clostridiales bacterium]
MFYCIAKAILRFLSMFVFRIKTVGKNNVIKEGGAIFAVNHRSCWDPVLVALTSPRRLSFMAKSELFKNKLFAAIIKGLGAFPVHRGKGDIGAIKTALTILNQGKIMMMFPEGKRVKDGEPIDIKPGIAMIAAHAKVPVVPVCITGKYHWLSRITVNYGEPVYLDEYYDERLSVEKLQEISTSLMNRVYALGKAEK